MWLVGGLYTLLGAVCLTELGTMLPQAGGYYVYARRAFGDTVGFAVGWSDWLTYCAVLGYVSIAMGEFTAVLVPALAPAIKLVAIAVLVCFTALQWAGVRVSSRFQEVDDRDQVPRLPGPRRRLLRARRVRAGRPRPCPPRTFRQPAWWGSSIALQSVAITFGGWQSALYFTEEDRDPRRNLPRSMIGGVLSVLVDLPARQRRPAGRAARSRAGTLDAARRGRRAGHLRRARRAGDHAAVARLAAAAASTRS